MTSSAVMSPKARRTMRQIKSRCATNSVTAVTMPMPIAKRGTLPVIRSEKATSRKTNRVVANDSNVWRTLLDRTGQTARIIGLILKGDRGNGRTVRPASQSTILPK